MPEEGGGGGGGREAARNVRARMMAAAAGSSRRGGAGAAKGRPWGGWILVDRSTIYPLGLLWMLDVNKIHVNTYNMENI